MWFTFADENVVKKYTLQGEQLVESSSIDSNLTDLAGCNNYSVGYEVDGDNISIGPALGTLMECAEPDGIMEQEFQYLAALGTAATYKIELGHMEMRTAEGALVGTFERMQP